MEGDAVAFCPGHISGWFRPEFSSAENAPGSVGGGIVIDRGVESAAARSDKTSVTCLYTDGEGSVIKTIEGSPPVEYALKSAGITAKITTRTDLPQESGFGLSGAAIISSLAAGADVAGVQISVKEILRIAYMTEISFRTGLGDVPAVAAGGYVCRTSPGLGGEIIRRYDMDRPLFTVNFGSLPTADVLGEKDVIKRINEAFPSRCPKSPQDFFRTARVFSEKSGLITRKVREVLLECDSKGIPACMTMLGNGVFAYGDDAKAVLGDFGGLNEVRMSKTGFNRRNKR